MRFKPWIFVTKTKLSSNYLAFQNIFCYIGLQWAHTNTELTRSGSRKSGPEKQLTGLQTHHRPLWVWGGGWGLGSRDCDSCTFWRKGAVMFRFAALFVESFSLVLLSNNQSKWVDELFMKFLLNTRGGLGGASSQPRCQPLDHPRLNFRIDTLTARESAEADPLGRCVKAELISVALDEGRKVHGVAYLTRYASIGTLHKEPFESGNRGEPRLTPLTNSSDFFGSMTTIITTGQLLD